jgi:hypothetical protein
MTSTPYSPIGPFKGVPSDVLARAALHANNAYEASAASLVRQAAIVGDETSKSAVVHSSVSAANAVWAGVQNDAVSSLKSANGDYHFWLAILATLGGASALSLLIAIIGNKPDYFAPGFAAGFIAVIACGLPYLGIVGPALTARREIREQGYFGDCLLVALGCVAGHAMLPGTQALHIATTDVLGKVSVKAVFWDAIGYATVEIDDNGLERVDIHGREGSVIGSITSPSVTDGHLDASGFAALVNERVAAVRKA